MGLNGNAFWRMCYTESTSDPRQRDAAIRYAEVMELSDEQIKAFIECWERDFSERLTAEQARVEARRLLDFFAELADAFANPSAPDRDAAEGTPSEA